MGTETSAVDKHQISELTDEIVDDLIKNSFRPVPVNIDKDMEEETEEVQMSDEKIA